jgi:nucleoside-diphosphate-sugar epimerase
MRVFLTGATGFIGSAIVPELLHHGHTVLGLARSDANAQSLCAAGAEVHRGDLEDLESLRSGAAECDAVIHAGFIHDFSRFVEVCEIDRRAIVALGDALSGSKRPLIITSGTGVGSPAPGEPAIEDHFDPHHSNPRIGSELAGIAVSEKGVDVRVVRLPQVHDPLKQGLVTYYITVTRETGMAVYVGDGRNRWPAVHRQAAAELYRLVLEKGSAGARYHAVAEEGIAARDIAAAVGRGLKVPLISKSPAESGAHFGWLAMFMAMDMPASSALTRQRLGWRPTGPGLIADLDQGRWT